jgi:phosphoribosylaminoimidazolecarboxamide formyltransferase/IMP cyclohydrolase
MSQLVRVRRALISVSDKKDLVPFARGLSELGVEIISTGGTSRALSDAGIAVIPVEEITGFPEMMDGRVKTLHPAIHGALLGRRDVDTHVQAMQDHGIVPIDLVCINLYPFEDTIKNPDVAHAEAIEQIDIGGPSMLRSAAKNHDFVAVVTSVSQYDRVINEMKATNGQTSLELRRDLAAAAFMRTAQYDTTISAWMCSARDNAFPTVLRMTYAHQLDLRYGENPHQEAALYVDPSTHEPSIVTAKVLHGKPLSYNNINDAAAAFELVQDLHDSAPDHVHAAVIKHTNPCGAASAGTLTDAFTLAYEGDSLAAYGGILAVSRPIDDATAALICEGQKFFEVIIAPSYSAQALSMLGERWKNVRLLDVGTIERSGAQVIDYRSVPGGMLVQERDTYITSTGDWKHTAGPKPDADLLADAAHIWTVAKHVKSNAVAIGKGGQLLGAGAGQMDRVASCRLAIEKAGARITEGDRPAIAASDAFFPFPDGPQELINAGVKCIVHPGGSKRDEDTFAVCNEANVTVLLTGVRHFRH